MVASATRAAIVLQYVLMRFISEACIGLGVRDETSVRSGQGTRKVPKGHTWVGQKATDSEAVSLPTDLLTALSTL